MINIRHKNNGAVLHTDGGDSLRAANLRGLNLAGADLAKADLRWVLFNGSDLTGATFEGADVAYADFSGCNLTGCNFIWAHTRGAKFTDAVLEGVHTVGQITKPTETKKPTKGVQVIVSRLEPSLTPARVASLVGVSQPAIHKRLGTIPGVYQSGGWQIPRGALLTTPLFNIALRNGIEVIENEKI